MGGRLVFSHLHAAILDLAHSHLISPWSHSRFARMIPPATKGMEGYDVSKRKGKRGGSDLDMKRVVEVHTVLSTCAGVWRASLE